MGILTSLHGVHATLTTSVEKGGWQKLVKGEATLKRGENREGLELFCLEFLKHNYKDVAGAESAFESFQKEKFIVG